MKTLKAVSVSDPLARATLQRRRDSNRISEANRRKRQKNDIEKTNTALSKAMTEIARLKAEQQPIKSRNSYVERKIEALIQEKNEALEKKDQVISKMGVEHKKVI